MKIEQVKLTKEVLYDILEKIKTLKVCFLGDICIDIYWQADMQKSTLSRETPHFPLPIVQEEFSLGGGGNVCANAMALGAKEVFAVSAMGQDWRWFLGEKCFDAAKISKEFILFDENFTSPCYCKPIRAGISTLKYEDPRLDFENREKISEALEEKIIQMLYKASETADVIIVSDQFDYGVVTPRVRAVLAEMGEKGRAVFVDSRKNVASFKNVIVKPNEVEAATCLESSWHNDIELPPSSTTNKNSEVFEHFYGNIAEQLCRRNNAGAIVTLGEKGAIWASYKSDENANANTKEVACFYAPAKAAQGETDIVGAGDTFLAAFALAYGAMNKGNVCANIGGLSAAFANLASAVTVKKIGTTGTATASEILAEFSE